MECKERIEAYLCDHHVTYDMREHARAFTAQDVAASEHLPGKLMAKVVMVFADGDMVMLVLPADHRANMAKVATALGVHNVWLADEQDCAHVFPDCEVGAMPPFGNLYGLPVYIDRLLADGDEIVFQAGTHTTTMKIAYADYARLVTPIVVDMVREPMNMAGML